MQPSFRCCGEERRVIVAHGLVMLQQRVHREFRALAIIPEGVMNRIFKPRIIDIGFAGFACLLVFLVEEVLFADPTESSFNTPSSW